MNEAVILVGGEGTRLKSISGDIPKPLMNVAGRPFVCRILDSLSEEGFDRVVLAVGYRAEYFCEEILKYDFGDMEILFSKEDIPLGTGGALKKASFLIEGNNFLALNGDSYCDIKLNSFSNYVFTRDAEIALVGVRVSNVERYGALKLNDVNDVVEVSEKGASGPGVINTGIYYINKELIQSMQCESFSFEKRVLEAKVPHISCYLVDKYFIDIGIPEDFRAAEEYFDMEDRSEV